MTNKNQWINIFAAEDVDRGLIKFIYFLTSESVHVDKLIIGPRVIKLHKTRITQNKNSRIIQNRKITFPFLPILKQQRFFVLLKSFLFNLIIRFYFNIKIQRVRSSFEEVRGRLEFVTVMYSTVGLLTLADLENIGVDLINIHPAKLPEFRGLDSSLWALDLQGRLGVTGYILEPGIDTGRIIKFFKLNPNSFSDLQSYKKSLQKLKYNSYLEVVRSYYSKKFEVINPYIEKSQNRGVMTVKNIVELAAKRFPNKKLNRSILSVASSEINYNDNTATNLIKQTVALKKIINNVELVSFRHITQEQLQVWMKKCHIDITECPNLVACNASSMRLAFPLSLITLFKVVTGKYDYIISQNIHFSYILSFFGISQVYEAHFVPTGVKKRLLTRILKKNCIVVVNSKNILSDCKSLTDIKTANKISVLEIPKAEMNNRDSVFVKSKIVNAEQAPNLADTSWETRAFELLSL